MEEEDRETETYNILIAEDTPAQRLQLMDLLECLENYNGKVKWLFSSFDDFPHAVFRLIIYSEGCEQWTNSKKNIARERYSV